MSSFLSDKHIDVLITINLKGDMLMSRINGLKTWLHSDLFEQKILHAMENILSILFTTFIISFIILGIYLVFF